MEAMRFYGMYINNIKRQIPGACRFYAEQLGREGLIGIVLAQSPEFVAPYGAKQAIFGTNPISVSIPANVRGRGERGDRGESLLCLAPTPTPTTPPSTTPQGGGRPRGPKLRVPPSLSSGGGD